MSTAYRLADIITRLTGATLDPVLACPHVEADGALAFCAAPVEAAIVVAAMALHGVRDCVVQIHDADPDDVYAVVRIPISSLESRVLAGGV